jgi:hypothetical protein
LYGVAVVVVVAVVAVVVAVCDFTGGCGTCVDAVVKNSMNSTCFTKIIL